MGNKRTEMPMKDLICFAKNHSKIICYGAGVYAGRILVFFDSLGKDIDCFVVTKKDKHTRFLGHPLYEAEEIEKWKTGDAAVIVAVSEEFHEAIRRTLMGKWEGDVYYVSSDVIQMLQDDKLNDAFLKKIIVYNSAFTEDDDTKAKEYDDTILWFKERFSCIEIRWLYGNLAGVSSEFIHYTLSVTNKEKYTIFYPLSFAGITNNYLDKPNEFLIKKFKGDYFEAIGKDNFYFWKYFISKCPSFFYGIIDDFYKKIIIPDKLKKLKKAKLTKNDNKHYISFTEEEKGVGDKWIRDKLQSAPFICIFARDSSYYKKEFQQRDYDLEDMDVIRNSDINLFDNLVEYFYGKGIMSVRMGATVRFEYTREGCVDFASKYYTPFLDAYLNAKCKFYIGNLSGAQHFTELFSKPFAILSPVLFYADDDTPLITSIEMDIMILQKYWYKKRNRYLSLREMIEVEQESFRKGGGKYCSLVNIFRWYAQNTIPVKNTGEEILDLALEMNNCIDGTQIYTQQDQELQRRYWEIVNKSNYEFGIPINARIGAKFLRENQWLLE